MRRLLIAGVAGAALLLAGCGEDYGRVSDNPPVAIVTDNGRTDAHNARVSCAEAGFNGFKRVIGSGKLGNTLGYTISECVK